LSGSIHEHRQLARNPGWDVTRKLLKIVHHVHLVVIAKLMSYFSPRIQPGDSL
jgi:hypothetical protein